MKLYRKIHRSYYSQYNSQARIALSTRLKQERGCCEHCGSQSNLSTHHKVYYSGRKVHEYEDEDLIVLCQPCHDDITEFADRVWMLALDFNPDQARRLYNLVVAVSENKERNLVASTRACADINRDLYRSDRMDKLMRGLAGY